MKLFMLICFQILIISGILYSYYYFFLRNKKFHLYNRYYLLSAVVMSLVIPFMDIPVFLTPEQIDSSVVLKNIAVSTPELNKAQVNRPSTEVTVVTKIKWQQIIFIAFGILVALGLTRLLISFTNLYRLLRQHVSEKVGNIRIIHTRIDGTPFSFFRWLFWNDNIEVGSADGKKILKHELYHIEKKHSFDLVFLEFINACCWFNPFFYLLKKELRAIHEFLADEYALLDSDKNEYAELLLMQSLQTRQRLVHPFFHNLIKRRVMMIVNSNKTSMQYLRKLLVLPLCLILTGLFAFTYKETSFEGLNAISNPVEFKKLEIKKKIHQINLSADTSVKPLIAIDQKLKHGETLENVTGNIDAGRIEKINVLKGEAAIKKYGKEGVNGIIEIFLIKDEKVNPEIAKPSKEEPIFIKVEEPASFPGGEEKFRRYIESKLPGRDGRELIGSIKAWVDVEFIVDTAGYISEVIAPLEENSDFGKFAVELIRKGPRWIPARQNGRLVKSKVTQRVEFFPEIITRKDDTDVPYSFNENNKITVSQLRKVSPHQLLRLPESTEILSYVFTIDMGKDILQIGNTGNKFTTSTKDQLYGAGEGRLITIDLIRIKEDDREKKLPSRIWYVVRD